MLTTLAMVLLQAAGFDGSFRADQGVVRLSEQQGMVRGTITLGSERVSLDGRISDGVLVGQAIDGYRKKFVFRATLTDGVLRLTIQSDTLEFTRETKAPRRRATALTMR